MNRAQLEDYRDTLRIRLTHRRGTGRETGADLGDLALLLDALLAEDSPAAPAIPGLVSMGIVTAGTSVYDATSAWPAYVRCHGMTFRTVWEPDPLANWSA